MSAVMLALSSRTAWWKVRASSKAWFPRGSLVLVEEHHCEPRKQLRHRARWHRVRTIRVRDLSG
jgi:hypothetical protein